MIAAAAVNVSGFHSCQEVEECLKSVQVAFDQFQTVDTAAEIKIFIFVYRGHLEFSKIADACNLYKFKLIAHDHLFNAAALNFQIEFSIDNNFDYFLRLDGDDTVHHKRFVWQISEITNDTTNSAVFGGGLCYRERLSGKCTKVFAAQNYKTYGYIFGLIFLHPSVAFDVSKVFIEAGLRYSEGRLEDKALAQELITSRLRIKNDQRVYGTYFYDDHARSSWSIIIRSFYLDITLALKLRRVDLLLLSVLVFMCRITLGVKFCRNIRNLLLNATFKC